MFTGLVESVGRLERIARCDQLYQLQISAPDFANSLILGESIACNGVCLTVNAIQNQKFIVDLLPETLRATTFSNIELGAPINLERALKVGDRLGGHFVSGHVDQTAKLKIKKNLQGALLLTFYSTTPISRYMVDKGSIAVNGVSLTLVHVADYEFSVQIIPHTQGVTNLPNLVNGSAVNIEFDILLKGIKKKANDLTLEKMGEWGYG